MSNKEMYIIRLNEETLGHLRDAKYPKFQVADDRGSGTLILGNIHLNVRLTGFADCCPSLYTWKASECGILRHIGKISRKAAILKSQTPYVNSLSQPSSTLRQRLQPNGNSTLRKRAVSPHHRGSESVGKLSNGGIGVSRRARHRAVADLSNEHRDEYYNLTRWDDDRVPIKRRIIQFLAQKKGAKSQVARALGVQADDVTITLNEVGSRSGDFYDLKPDLWQYVVVYEWGLYEEATRQDILKKMSRAFDHMGLPKSAPEWKSLKPPSDFRARQAEVSNRPLPSTKKVAGIGRQKRKVPKAYTTSKIQDEGRNVTHRSPSPRSHSTQPASQQSLTPSSHSGSIPPSLSGSSVPIASASLREVLSRTGSPTTSTWTTSRSSTDTGASPMAKPIASGSSLREFILERKDPPTHVPEKVSDKSSETAESSERALKQKDEAEVTRGGASRRSHTRRSSRQSSAPERGLRMVPESARQRRYQSRRADSLESSGTTSRQSVHESSASHPDVDAPPESEHGGDVYVHWRELYAEFCDLHEKLIEFRTKHLTDINRAEVAAQSLSEDPSNEETRIEASKLIDDLYEKLGGDTMARWKLRYLEVKNELEAMKAKYSGNF